MTNKNGAHEWVIDLNAIKAREIAAFQKAFDGIQQNEFGDFWPYAARIIKQWPYASDPSKVESYDDLGMLEFREVIVKLSKSFRDFISETESVAESLAAGS